MDFPFRPVPKKFRAIPTSAKKVFEGIIFDVYQWEQKMFDDTTETFEMLKRPDTIGVITIVDGKALILNEEQPNDIKRINFPLGRVNKNESILDAAYRELKEETGITPEKLYYVESIQEVGKIDWLIHFFISIGIKEQTDPKLDAGEKITLQTIEIDEIIERHKKLSLEMPEIFTELLLNNKVEEYKDRLLSPEKYFSEVKI